MNSKDNPTIILILLTIAWFYLYNTGRWQAILDIVNDKTYRTNFGLSQGITQNDTSGSNSDSSIFGDIASGLSSVLDIAGLFA